MCQFGLIAKVISPVTVDICVDLCTSPSSILATVLHLMLLRFGINLPKIYAMQHL